MKINLPIKIVLVESLFILPFQTKSYKILIAMAVLLEECKTVWRVGGVRVRFWNLAQ